MSLVLDKTSAGYGHLSVLHDVSLTVGTGQLVSLIGANGAGKTTALRMISGLLTANSGAITFEGRSLVGLAAHEVVRRGIVHVPEGRELFPELTVEENLEMGGYTRTRRESRSAIAEVFDLFPILAERRTQLALTMSGGQQQMLAIGRALVARPKLLLLDEPSLGLAPKIVAQVFGVLDTVRQADITVLLVEQNAAKALAVSDHAYVLESGSVSFDGPGESLLGDSRVKQAYLGI